MELEVRAVGGIESCFVALPLSLIQTLEATRGGFLPPVLALDLRSSSGGSWNLAWSGAASKSAAIEVDQVLAACIRLPDHTKVQVKALSHLPKATFVNIEPSSEDDWEILELNSELAEEVFLKQVGIVFEGMKFPLWLHGHIMVEFVVSSTFPNKPVVQLVPGTEVAIAPKKRKRGLDDQSIQKQASAEEKLRLKGLLRVQAENRKYVHKIVIKDLNIGILLTSVAFIHPETAKKLSFDNLQLASLLPKLPEKEIVQSIQKRENISSSNVVSAPTKEKSRHTVIRIVYSDLVAKGHIMLPESLRLFVGSAIHSWIYIKNFFSEPRKDAPVMTISPCRFNFSRKNNVDIGNETGILENHRNHKPSGLTSSADLLPRRDRSDRLPHEEYSSSIIEASRSEDDESISRYHTRLDNMLLIKSWIIGQLCAITSLNDKMEVNSLIFTHETLLHFEISDRKLGNRREENLPSGDTSRSGRGNEESATQLLYLLRFTSDEPSKFGLHDCYELVLNNTSQNIGDLHELEKTLGKIDLGAPLFLNSVSDSIFRKSFDLALSSLSWMEAAISDVVSRLSVLLSPTSCRLLSTYGLPCLGHVLIYGPAGSGKTTLTRAVARHFEEHKEILAHIVYINCSKVAIEKTQTVQKIISRYISEALAHSPSIVIFDDMDSLISVSSDTEGSQLSSSTTALVKYFTDVMDEYGEKSRGACGFGSLAFVASVQSLHNLPQSLSSSGRFDFHVQLPAPAVSERGAILKHEIQKRSLQCSDDIVSEVAKKCDGYDAYDLEILVDRAIHAAVSRFVFSNVIDEDKMPVLAKEDFRVAMHEFVPVAMRGLTKAPSEGGRSGWDDVGGLTDTRNAIQEMLELPSKFSGIFAQSPLRLRSNVLLYGPPGCGKTHIVGAAAAACSLRFISIKGPELLNKYIGASEQAVRDLFSKAAAAAPCLLFFDEFDSIAPKRGHDNTGVTDRVVNQLLTELDGVEALTGVFVFAATSRPDLLDAALLRPGRLDRLLFCDFPSMQERLDILKVLSKKLPLASSINLERVASITEGFSGADLQALLSDAQLASVHELLDGGDREKPGKVPVISEPLLMSVASKARPSVSEAEKHRLYGIYSQFLDAKKSVSAQSRDAKGKKATLA